MNQMKKIGTILLLITLTLGVLYGCGEKEEPKDVKNPSDAITLGSFVDTEGGILGNMVLLVLEQAGYLVEDKVQFGVPDVHRNALLQGELDLGIDYTGNGQFYSEGIDAGVWVDAVLGYEAIAAYDKEENGLIWMAPAKANNTEALAMKKDFAEAEGIVTMEDFARYVNEGGRVKLITSQLFAEKDQGLLGLEKAYGFKLSSDQLILLPHGNTAETLKALANGTDDVNVALAYATDGSLVDLNLVIIEDPMSIPPVYEPSAIIRKEVLDLYPEIQPLVEEVFALLTKENLQQMNKDVIVEGLAPKKVAEDFLKGHGLLTP